MKPRIRTTRRDIAVTVKGHTLWLGWFPGQWKPVDHPEGKRWALWKEDGEWFGLTGPLLVTFGRV